NSSYPRVLLHASIFQATLGFTRRGTASEGAVLQTDIDRSSTVRIECGLTMVTSAAHVQISRFLRSEKAGNLMRNLVRNVVWKLLLVLSAPFAGEGQSRLPTPLFIFFSISHFLNAAAACFEAIVAQFCLDQLDHLFHVRRLLTGSLGVVVNCANRLVDVGNPRRP